MQELDWLLTDLAETVAGVRSAVVLSSDGLAMGSSPGLAEADGEYLAALAAGVSGLAHGTGARFGCGELQQIIIEMDTGLLFLTPAARGTCLALLADSEADAGQVAYEMSLLVKRVGQHMIANPRFLVPHPV